MSKLNLVGFRVWNVTPPITTNIFEKDSEIFFKCTCASPNQKCIHIAAEETVMRKAGLIVDLDLGDKLMTIVGHGGWSENPIDV